MAFSWLKKPFIVRNRKYGQLSVCAGALYPNRPSLQRSKRGLIELISEMSSFQKFLLRNIDCIITSARLMIVQQAGSSSTQGHPTTILQGSPEYRLLTLHSKRVISFVSVRSFLGKSFSLFDFAKASQYLFSRKSCNYKFYEGENFSDSSPNHILESENIKFPSSTNTSLPQ